MATSSTPDKAPEPQRHDKVRDHYYIVSWSGNGLHVHSDTDDKVGAHRVAKSVGGSVLTLSRAVDE